MPSDYQSKSIEGAKRYQHLNAAEQVRRNCLTILVRRYEAVRSIRGPERDAAERALGVALSRHEGPFGLDGWIWQWSRTEQSLMRHKALTHTGVKKGDR